MISDRCASSGAPGPTGGTTTGTDDSEVAAKSLPLLGILGLGSLMAGLFVRR
jgi:hypothetical protein